LLIVAGYASVFLELGVISALGVIPAGIALGILIYSSDSLDKSDVLGLGIGGLLGCVLVLAYVYWLGHHWVSPKQGALALFIFFGVGPIISGLRVFLRRKRKVT
jgi:hypothetical protein